MRGLNKDIEKISKNDIASHPTPSRPQSRALCKIRHWISVIALKPQCIKLLYIEGLGGIKLVIIKITMHMHVLHLGIILEYEQSKTVKTKSIDLLHLKPRYYEISV